MFCVSKLWFLSLGFSIKSGYFLTFWNDQIFKQMASHAYLVTVCRVLITTVQLNIWPIVRLAAFAAAACRQALVPSLSVFSKDRTKAWQLGRLLVVVDVKEISFAEELVVAMVSTRPSKHYDMAGKIKSNLEHTCEKNINCWAVCIWWTGVKILKILPKTSIIIYMTFLCSDLCLTAKMIWTLFRFSWALFKRSLNHSL